MGSVDVSITVFQRLKSRLKSILKELWFLAIPRICIAKAFDRDIAFLVLSQTHGNLGDHAIAAAEKMVLTKKDVHYLEISDWTIYYLEHKNKLSIFNGNDILVCGGGFLGTLWFENEKVVRSLLMENPDSTITVFPNTLYFEDSAYGREEYENSKRIYNSHPKLKIYARERHSYELLKQIGVPSALVPDMVMLLKTDAPSGSRAGCVLLLRGDHERTRSYETDQIIDNAAHKLFGDNVKHSDTVIRSRVPFIPTIIPFSCRKRKLEKKYRELKGAELVITDRLHGMIFSAITGTPCIVLNSKSPKVLGCYEWIKHLDYIRICTDPNDIVEIYEQMPHGNQIYDNSKLIPLFDDLFRTLDELRH